MFTYLELSDVKFWPDWYMSRYPDKIPRSLGAQERTTKGRLILKNGYKWDGVLIFAKVQSGTINLSYFDISQETHSFPTEIGKEEEELFEELETVTRVWEFLRASQDQATAYCALLKCFKPRFLGKPQVSYLRLTFLVSI